MKVFRVKTTGCPEKNWLIEKNPHQNWVLRGQIFPWTWIRSGWSCLVLVRNDQKHFSRHRGCRLLVIEQPVQCTPWVQQHPVSHFFGDILYFGFKVTFFGTPCTLDSTLTFLMWLLSPAPVDIISMLIVNMEWDLKFGLLSYAVQSNFVVICSSRVRSKWSGVKSNLEESAFIFVAPVALGYQKLLYSLYYFVYFVS